MDKTATRRPEALNTLWRADVDMTGHKLSLVPLC